MYLTEEELLERQREQLFGLQKLFKTQDIDFDDICTLIPGVVHLNKLHTIEMVYLDRTSREKLNVSKEEIAQNGDEVLLNNIDPQNLSQIRKLFSKIDFEDPSRVVSYFQLLRGISTNRKDYQWFYSVKKRFNQDLTISITNSIQTLDETHYQLTKVLEENLFIRNNLSKLDSLSKREKEIMKLIYQGQNSKEIAEKLFLSPHTVRTHRKNIWNKLEISNYAELIKFAEQFDMI